MKRIITILFVGISLIVVAQDSLPLNNRLIMDFVKNNNNKRVGNGICEQLVFKALEYADSITKRQSDTLMYCVDPWEVIPGDVVEFDSVIWKDGHITDSHVGIVYGMGNGRIAVAQQNRGDSITYVSYRGAMAPLVYDSRVEIDLMFTDDIVSGNMYFYRRF